MMQQFKRKTFTISVLLIIHNLYRIKTQISCYISKSLYKLQKIRQVNTSDRYHYFTAQVHLIKNINK